MKTLQTIIALCALALCLALFQTLIPVYAEWSGEAEREIQDRLDAESCQGTNYRKVNNVVYCEYKGRLVKPKDYKELIK